MKSANVIFNRKIIMIKRLLNLLLIIIFIFFGCQKIQYDTITQISTIDALLAGLYDGSVSGAKLLKQGNLGIGTFDKLDGEMIVYDGTVYQARADGKVYKPDLDFSTPFATVCYFNQETTFLLEAGINFSSLEEKINQIAPNQNIFCAFKVKAKFDSIKTRSVPAQKKPYPPLSEVTKNQPEFIYKNVSGFIVGFRCPPYVKGINVPGYHLHFLSDDFSKGGHILDFKIKNGNCQIDLCDKFFLILPKDETGFQNIDLSKDRSDELMEVEK
jgi:acetolactate decarboxylase